MMARRGGTHNRRAAMAGVVSYSDGMLFWVRTVVIWCLVLALPVQGAAAATMVMCDPHPHGIAGGAPHQKSVPAEPAAGVPHALPAHTGGWDAAGAQQGHPGHGERHGPGQAADLAGVDTGSGPVATPLEAPAAKMAHADQHDCSACASCCSAAAFSSQVVKVPAPPMGRATFASLVPSVERFACGGPDRPPRPLVA